MAAASTVLWGHVLADLPEGCPESGVQSAGRLRGEVGDEARARPPDLLQGELDPKVAALVAVVEDGDRPRHLGALEVVGGMVVAAVVGELLHPPTRPCRAASTLARYGAHRAVEVVVPRRTSGVRSPLQGAGAAATPAMPREDSQHVHVPIRR